MLGQGWIWQGREFFIVSQSKVRKAPEIFWKSMKIATLTSRPLVARHYFSITVDYIIKEGNHDKEKTGAG